jgi:hypothetical protein
MIGLILIPCAILFLLLLLQLWPPPKPREGFKLAFEQSKLEVPPGSPATYTISVRAPSTFSELVMLEAVVLPDNLPSTFVPYGKEPTRGLLIPSAVGSSAVLTLQTPQTQSGQSTEPKSTVLWWWPPAVARPKPLPEHWW